MTTLISIALLSATSAAAKASPRQRKNHNFHRADSDLCHRLLNALEPQTYIPPHCHLDTSKAESIIILRGRVGVLFFSAQGEITEKCCIQPQSDCLGVDISPGTLHSLVALEPNSVFFEAKAGPYVPLSAAERAPWAPQEGDLDVVRYLAWMKSQFI